MNDLNQPTLEDLCREVQELEARHGWHAVATLLEKNIAVSSRDYKLSFSLGWAHYQLRHLADARRHFRRLIELKPGRAVGHWAYGLACMDDMDLGTAERHLVESLRLKDVWRTRVALGFLYYQFNDLDRAQQVLEEGVNSDPAAVDRVEFLAWFLNDVGRVEPARAWYAKADALHRARIADAPDNAEPLEAYGRFLQRMETSEAAEDEEAAQAADEAAERALRETMKARPNEWEPLRAYARFLFARDRDDEAFAALRKMPDLLRRTARDA